MVRRPFSIAESYQVDELIGAGTRSFVFGGRVVSPGAHGSRVAIKVLRPQIAADLEARERFLHEASALGLVIHPHVIRVIDAGWDEPLGLAYLVMDREAGQAADAMIKQAGPLLWSQAVPLLVQICRGVAAAHACGINDGDFTAGKVFMVTGVAGRIAKLRDFGLSRRATSGATASDDVYGIGTVAHELVTGRPPLEGSSAAAMLSDDPIRVNERFPALALPSALDDLIRACRLRDPLLRPSPTEIEASLMALGVPGSPRSPEYDAEPTAIVHQLSFSPSHSPSQAPSATPPGSRSIPAARGTRGSFADRADRLPPVPSPSWPASAVPTMLTAPVEPPTFAPPAGFATEASAEPTTFTLPAEFAPAALVEPMTFASPAGSAPVASAPPPTFASSAGFAPAALAEPTMFALSADLALASSPASVEPTFEIDAGATLPGSAPASAFFSAPGSTSSPAVLADSTAMRPYEAPPFRDGSAVLYSAVAHPGNASYQTSDHDPSRTLEDAMLAPPRRSGRRWILVGLGGALLAALVFLGVGITSRSTGETAEPARKVSEGAASSTATPTATSPPASPRSPPAPPPSAAGAVVVEPVSAASVAAPGHATKPTASAPRVAPGAAVAPASTLKPAVVDQARPSPRPAARTPSSAAPPKAPDAPSTAAAEGSAAASGSGEQRPRQRPRPDKKPEYKDVLIIDPFSRGH